MSTTNFASTTYASAFLDLPVPNPDKLRASAVEYIDNFNPRLWYEDPVVSILKGDKLKESAENPQLTTDALGNPNGHQILATPAQVEALRSHIETFRSPYQDIRTQLRRVEQRLLDDYAGFLIGNQCLDFGKQDGVTEIEEAIMANAVERNLNDMLLEDEVDGKITISRKMIYVSCVSNFTNFLDLFRKTIRSLELGVPCVILGRSNTVQHSYRWTELLVELMKEEGIEDLGMITYMSCALDDIKDVTRSCRNVTGNLYATCSRAMAADMTIGYPNTIASTGGPNTMVTTEWTEAIKDAIRMSATIESSGQCTALRHCVIPDNVGLNDIQELFHSTKSIPDAPHALKSGIFDGVFANHKGSPVPATGEYIHNATTDVYFRVGHKLPKDGMEEYWRKVVVDFSQTLSGTVWEDREEELFPLAKWLNQNQPISLAINARYSKMLELGLSLFEMTGMVVYTIGSTNNPDAPPALTCQARPQDGEIFGEFPPRRSLRTYTKYPVFVPSSTPSYDSTYTTNYLKSLKLSHSVTGPVRDIVKSVESKVVRGYCIELLHYLHDATRENPKRGFGTLRTALWGLQRPPIMVGLKTRIHCPPQATLDDLAPLFLLFYATNARDELELSVDPLNKSVLSFCQRHNLPALVHTKDQDKAHHMDTKHMYNFLEITGPMDCFPLVGQFVSLYMPLGHVKSTMKDDNDFIEKFTESKKWLKMHE